MLEKVVGEHLGGGYLRGEKFSENSSQKMLEKVVGDCVRRGNLRGQKFSKKPQPENVRKSRWKKSWPRISPLREIL